MYCCSSLTWASSSDSFFTRKRNVSILPQCPHTLYICIPRNGRTFGFERIARQFGLRYVDDSVDVERDFLAVRRPRLVSKAVYVFAIAGCSERVFVGGYGCLVVLMVTDWVLDLKQNGSCQYILRIGSGLGGHM